MQLCKLLSISQGQPTFGLEVWDQVVALERERKGRIAAGGQRQQQQQQQLQRS
jgi:hypothetical protein